MNGLDSIVNKILEEAKGEADAILADAQKQADEMLGEADQEAQRQAAQRWESAEKKAESIRAAKVSAAHLSGRERILAAKGQAIDQILYSCTLAEQAEVDSMAQTIEAAAAALVLRPAD